MGFRDLARTLARTGLKAAGDIPARCLYLHSDGDTEYSTDDGEPTPDTQAAESLVDLIFSPVQESDRRKTAKENSPTGEEEALALDVTQFNRRPAKGDTLTKQQGLDQYIVLDVVSDEADATYTLTVKRVGSGVSDEP